MPLKTKQMTEMLFVFLFPLLVWFPQTKRDWARFYEEQDTAIEDVFLLCMVVLLFS